MHDHAGDLAVILTRPPSQHQAKSAGGPGRRAHVERNACELSLRRGGEARAGGKRTETCCGDWDEPKEQERKEGGGQFILKGIDRSRS